MRDPARTDPLPKYACDGEGALHTTNRFNNSNVDPSRFGGTALAIAYTSDVASLQPSDMTVISVNHYSPWTREISYAIPAGLPPCPAGGCLCTWNWIHQSSNGEGYGQEIYNNLYRCTVTGNTDSTKVVQKGLVPKDCTGNPSGCVKGAKQPMYLYQASGNNLPNLPTPPNYNDNWGFADGAQNDIFTPTSTGGGASAPTATALPTGWTAIGCYVDQDPRSLGVAMGSSNTMTISSCTADCAKQGYTYAGVQAGQECWCSNNPKLVSAPASECQTPCKGDTWAFCGGNWRLNVFKAPNAGSPTTPSTAKPTPFPTASLPAGWSAVGCIIDSGSSRTLDSGSSTSSSNTVLSCIAQAQAKGLAYAGVQYGQECWLGTAASSKNFKITSNDECNVACAGDTGTLCGGAYRLNVYANNALVAASSSSVAATTTTMASVAPTTAAAPTTTTAPAVPSTPAAGWSSLGCHSDVSSARLLPAYSITSPLNSPNWCTSHCASKGYTYAGTEYSNQCYCGNTLKTAPATGCTYACTGDKGSTCGGYWKMNVYTKGASLSNSGVEMGSGNGVEAVSSTAVSSTGVSSTGVVTVTVTVTQTEGCAATQMAKRRIHWHNSLGDRMAVH